VEDKVWKFHLKRPVKVTSWPPAPWVHVRGLEKGGGKPCGRIDSWVKGWNLDVFIKKRKEF